MENNNNNNKNLKKIKHDKNELKNYLVDKYLIRDLVTKEGNFFHESGYNNYEGPIKKNTFKLVNDILNDNKKKILEKVDEETFDFFLKYTDYYSSNSEKSTMSEINIGADSDEDDPDICLNCYNLWLNFRGIQINFKICGYDKEKKGILYSYVDFEFKEYIEKFDEYDKDWLKKNYYN